MQPLSHNAGAVGVGGQVIANGARGLATGTAATAQVSALTPAGADEGATASVAAGAARVAVPARAQVAIWCSGAPTSMRLVATVSRAWLAIGHFLAD